MPIFKAGVFNAWIFAVCFFLISFSIMIINRKVHRKLGNHPDMRLSKREKVVGYIATMISYVAFLYSIFLPFKLGTVWFYTGLFIFLAAVAAVIAAGISFITTPIDKPVVKGIYRYSRHPIYLSNTLALLGIGIATASWIILLTSIIFLILADIVAASEERYCKKKYGENYKKYSSRTPRWIGIPKT